MTDEQKALARRAVACKGWRWMPGMKLTAGLRLSESLVPFTYPVDLPDFDDAATLGCLFALVREAWGCAVITAPDYDDDEEGAQGPLVGWRAVETVRWISVSRGTTEAGALVAALEAAP